ncbi:MAG: PAS domain S-box protein [Methanomicrobiales archaeon]
MTAAIRVLYADDEPDLLEIGKLFLEQSRDFTVTTAMSGPDAIRLFEQEWFDAIISDYQMPGMDGIQFLIEVRKRFGSVPFILFTGKGREEVVIQAINNGVDFYLQKGGAPEAQFAELGHKIQQAVQRKRAEDGLRINEERLSMAQAMGGIGSWEFDPVTNTLWGSPEAFRIFGYPSTADGTIRLDEIGVCITERERVRLALKNLIENGDEYNLEYSISPADGSDKKILHSVGQLQRDASGKIINISGVIQDITDVKKSEELIIRERENFHTILSTAPVGLLLINQDQVITQANRYLSSIVFREPAQIVGKRVGEGIGCIHSTEEPRGCSFSTSCPECPLRNGIERVQEEGKSLNGAVIDLTLLIHGKPEHRWLSVNAEPIELDGVRHTIVSVDDISAHMEYEEERIRKSDELSAAYEQIAAIEEELRQNYNELAAGQHLLQESRQYLQSIVQGSPIPTFVIDKEHRVTSWNRALVDYLGISADQVIGKPLAGQAFYKTNRPSLADLIVDQASDEIPKWYEGKFSRSSEIEGAYEVTDFFPTMKGGTWLFFTASPICDDKGDLIGAIETLQDITGRKRAEETLTRTNEELNAAYEELAATEEELRQNLDEVSKTQQDLLESEVRFRSAMNHLPGTAWAVDRDLRYTLSQGAGLSQMGLKPDQVVGMTLYEFFSTRDPSHPVISQHLRALNGEEIGYDYTYEGISFRTYLSPLHDALGNITGVTGLAFNITEQRRAEEELQKSEERYRLMNDASLDYIYSYDRSGCFTNANRSLCAAMRLRTDQILGRTHKELGFPDAQCRDWDELHRRVYETGTTVTAFTSTPMPDGTIRHYEVVLNPLHDISGAITGIAGTTRDTTDRKRVEEALRESEEKYRTLVEQANEAIIITQNGAFVFANRRMSEILDVPPGYLEGKPFIDYIWPGDREMVAENHRKRISGETIPDIYDFRIIGTGGSLIWISLSAAVIHWKGKPATLNMVTDITLRKRAEEALLLTNRKLSILSGITRHDINNQMTVLMGYLRILEKKQNDPTLKDYTRKTAIAAERVTAMIRFTKEYEEIGVCAPIWQDARLLVDNTATEAPLGTVIIKNDLPSGTEVFADPLIRMIFYNLMDNAARYGGKITTIRFSTEESGDDHLVVCEDDGEGIVAEEKEKIFERGYGKNTGMGLFLSREILSITGISIRETGEPGKGARFEMMVPKGMYRYLLT